MADNSSYRQNRDSAVRTLGNESTYAGNTSFLDRVFSVMRNVFIKYRSQSHAAAVADSTEGLYHMSLTHDSSHTVPEGCFSAKDVSKAISRFKEAYRAPFTMYLTGYSYNEIAQSMNLPLGTVRNRISMARRHLQNVMAQ
jgi:RNA polymerase ECF-type sigma factor